ncbi:MAG: hypothetical protein RLQ12_24900, partial [Cyclobacteriaceae bacterium]
LSIAFPLFAITIFGEVRTTSENNINKFMKLTNGIYILFEGFSDKDQQYFATLICLYRSKIR